jgi:hypothetical protein
MDDRIDLLRQPPRVERLHQVVFDPFELLRDVASRPASPERDDLVMRVETTD